MEKITFLVQTRKSIDELLPDDVLLLVDDAPMLIHEHPKLNWDDQNLYGETQVNIYPHHIETVLPGGDIVPAAPMRDRESVQRAHALGYGGDVWAMTLDHDRLHSALCHALGLSESPALRQVANGLGSSELSDAEEHLVLAAQRFLNLCRTSGML